ncbi:patatin family protein [Enterovibrio sp. ZSDZ35]|uniref:Patatin family protein n=1 Tax=Enterovibrio qingdaonensis TaxID=2899818 RepID=A0ABT5QIQ9_9GAMM|nr:patatin-like phospholipase family protein [Enterovibrio sp. ZSDZ35]MDD1780875.1 patatin family protein [Enterovibrio sp. ZSDZ35]
MQSSNVKKGSSLTLDDQYKRHPYLSQTQSRKLRVALVAQGGGQRGVFTAGVIDAFLEAQFDPFELYIGTSAGALNLSSYITRQRGFGFRFITQYTTHDRFFNLMKYVRRQQFMDLDWALEAAGPNHPGGLRVENARSILQKRRAYACVTNTHTLEPEYFHLLEDNYMDVLKATCAIPLLYPESVQIGDHHFVDGGVSGAIPAREAYNRGADIIIVIRTEPVEEEEAEEEMTDSSAFLDNLKTRMEQRLPQYYERFNVEDRLEKLQDFHGHVQHHVQSLKTRYKESHQEPIWHKLRDMVPDKLNKNGGRWLFGGESIYRLQAMSGHRVNADMFNMLTKHYQSYHDAIEFMANPPSRTLLMQIAPDAPLESSALLSKSFQLKLDYFQGHEMGRAFLNQYGSALNTLSTVGK